MGTTKNFVLDDTLRYLYIAIRERGIAFGNKVYSPWKEVGSRYPARSRAPA
jgi:hypothetical protein